MMNSQTKALDEEQDENGCAMKMKEMMKRERERRRERENKMRSNLRRKG